MTEKDRWEKAKQDEAALGASLILAVNIMNQMILPQLLKQGYLTTTQGLWVEVSEDKDSVMVYEYQEVH